MKIYDISDTTRRVMVGDRILERPTSEIERLATCVTIGAVAGCAMHLGLDLYANVSYGINNCISLMNATYIPLGVMTGGFFTAFGIGLTNDARFRAVDSRPENPKPSYGTDPTRPSAKGAEVTLDGRNYLLRHDSSGKLKVTEMRDVQ